MKAKEVFNRYVRPLKIYVLPQDLSKEVLKFGLLP